MKKIYYYAMAVGLLVMPLIGCSNDNHEGDIVVDMLPKTRSVDLTQEQKEYVKRSNEFALNLYKAVIQGQNDNKSTIVSPISAVYMLGMLNDGSAGKTAEEISTVLGFGKDGKQAINEFCKAMIEQTPEADPSVWLQTANCVVVNDKQHVELQDQFVNDISKYYRGEVMTLNFASAKSLDRINNWSNQYTDGMIPTVLNQLN